MQKVDLRDYLDKRLPIGVLLLALAAFCIWQGREPDGLNSLIFGACVGFLGLLAVGERRFLVIDEQAGVLRKKRGIIFAITHGSLALAEIECVELSSYVLKRGRKGGGRTKRYRVSVTGPKSGVLADYGDEWRARGVGERVSAALRVPFDNRLYGRRSVRKANELDLPLAERWRVSGKIKEQPALPEASRIAIDDVGMEIRVHFPADKASLKGVAAMAVILAVGGALFYPLMDELGERVFFYGFFGLVFVFLCVLALAFSGRSRLTFTERSVAFRQGQAPMERSIELQSIEEMISGWDALYLVSDSASIAIDWPESDEDQDFLKAFVAYEIARRHTRSDV